MSSVPGAAGAQAVTTAAGLVGAHVRGQGGIAAALSRARQLGAGVAQTFVGSPRTWRAGRMPSEQDVEAATAQGGPALFVHASYLVNLASPDPGIWARSVERLSSEIRAAGAVGASGVVLHAGSHRGDPLGGWRERLVDGLRRAMDVSERPSPVLLENTAGAGDTVGRSFAELAVLLERAGPSAGMGVCIDSQHLFAGGVRFDTEEAVEALLAELDATVGLGAVRLLHCNDSSVPFDSRRDRHENLGDGQIGTDALGLLLGHPALASVPVVLEVPGAGDGPGPGDLDAARAMVAAGARRWARRRGWRQWPPRVVGRPG